MKQIEKDLEKAMNNFVSSYESYIKHQKTNTPQKNLVNINDQKYSNSKVVPPKSAPLMAKTPQKLFIHYIDVTKSQKTSNWLPEDGKEIQDNLQILSGFSGEKYENEVIIPAGYEISYLESNAEKGTFELDSKKEQHTFVYISRILQKIYYSIYDDTAKQFLEEHLLFDEGPANQKLNKTNNDLEKIWKKYSEEYKLVSVDQLPDRFNNDSPKNQLINIHLKAKEATSEQTEKNFSVKESRMDSGLVIGGITIALVTAALFVGLKKNK